MRCLIGFGKYSSVVTICLALVACINGGQPLVEDRGQPPPVAMRTHQVSTGETLYSIAWTYGKDFHQIAGINGIVPPYTIYPGQRLILEGVAKNQVPTKPVERIVVVKSPQPVIKNPTPKYEAEIPRTPTVVASPTPIVEGWYWPSKGRVIKGFSVLPIPHKGIDISGSKGDPVYAANHGVVVYAGEGIRGYGRLIIVKHDNVYLSAYAHNDQILVKEAERVKAGQKIAEIGSSGTDSVKLHFELRKNGNPINPLSVLPKF